MSNKTLVIFVVVSAAACAFATESYGQRRTLRLNQGFRYLGGGQSAGYHWRTPGTNVNYYDPWSFHNTNTQTGIVPQGAPTWLGHGNCGGAYLPYDHPATYDDYGGYFNDVAPSIPAATNVIDAQIDADTDVNSTGEAESILRDRKIKEPTPADDAEKKIDDETTMLLSPDFFDSNPIQGQPNRNSNRGQAVFRNSSHRQPK